VRPRPTDLQGLVVPSLVLQAVPAPRRGVVCVKRAAAQSAWQSDQPPAQSASAAAAPQACALQASCPAAWSAAAQVVARPPFSAGCVTVKTRVRVPPPHSEEQPPHAPHAPWQFTVQGSGLQSWVWTSPTGTGHAAPPEAAGTLTSYARLRAPPPHAFEHSPQAPHAPCVPRGGGARRSARGRRGLMARPRPRAVGPPTGGTWQSCAQAAVLHGRSSCAPAASAHGAPPPNASAVMR
jgi:hypothetical protein